MHPEIKEIVSMEEKYLLLTQIPDEETFEEEMLLYNAIPGLLPMETGKLSGVKYHRYRVSHMVSLSKSLPGKRLSGVQFEQLFASVFGKIRRAKEYMLREDGFLILPETLYADEATGEIGLCYCPEYHCPLVEQMKNLSDWLLTYLDPADEKAVYNGYAFHVLCHGDNCSFQSIAQVLNDRPALPEVSTFREEEPEIPYREKKPKKHAGILLGGSMLFLAWIGALLFFVMR